jgi:hypothetical protein
MEIWLVMKSVVPFVTTPHTVQRMQDENLGRTSVAL